MLVDDNLYYSQFTSKPFLKRDKDLELSCHVKEKGRAVLMSDRSHVCQALHH